MKRPRNPRKRFAIRLNMAASPSGRIGLLPVSSKNLRSPAGRGSCRIGRLATNSGRVNGLEGRAAGFEHPAGGGSYIIASHAAQSRAGNQEAESWQFAAGRELWAEARDGSQDTDPTARTLQPDRRGPRGGAASQRHATGVHAVARRRGAQPRRDSAAHAPTRIRRCSPDCARSSSSRFPWLRLPRRRPPVPPRRRASSRSRSRSSRPSWRPSRCRPRSSPSRRSTSGAERASPDGVEGGIPGRCRGRHRRRAAGRPSRAGRAGARRRPGSRAAPAVGPAARLSRARDDGEAAGHRW